jgi:hypothetical protein
MNGPSVVPMSEPSVTDGAEKTNCITGKAETPSTRKKVKPSDSVTMLD